jgi:beta-galactosidase
MQSRREFLTRASGAAVASALPVGVTVVDPSTPTSSVNQGISLDGDWWFRLDPNASGETGAWFAPQLPTADWLRVTVPHVWQIAHGTEDYRGVAWYRRAFEMRPEWRGHTIRIEFEAVFHSAAVWVNGRAAGEHLRKGYTAFAFDITTLLHSDAPNNIAVRVNNAFDENMLPRGRSSDWAHDGGMYRPVRLLVTPAVYIERLAVEALPDLAANTATLEISAVVRNTSNTDRPVQLGYRVIEGETGPIVLTARESTTAILKSGETRTIDFPPVPLAEPKLWHFDHPHLYQFTVMLTAAADVHELSTTFGVRRIEVKNGGFYVNGERVRLMGVERMAGSNPEFGMAEPSGWITHDHDDLKNLNCVFTRAHWPQDARVLDYCDRHGIFIQTEVPTWGPDTFKGMGPDPLPALMQNGLEQLREMIDRDRNHPSLFSWGLCNEINGQHPPAAEFARRMYQEAKKINPHRLCSYASNSLQQNPGKDVSGIMDFIEWNEYYETWYGGTPEDLRRNLNDIHLAFPEKPIVISEYGYCACTPERPENDPKRVSVLTGHDRVFRDAEFVAGLIFFCYNDYRTHIGDRGVGACAQRIHGVVDLYGAHKPSYEVLRHESSTVASLNVTGGPSEFSITVRARNSVPAYTMNGYKVRGILYGAGDIPLERREAALQALAPGQESTVKIAFTGTGARRIQFDLIRPTDFSAYTHVWLS